MIVDFADLAIILPALVYVTIILALTRHWRVALVLLFISSLVLGSIGLLKTLTYACAWRGGLPPFHWMTVQSPSGHAAAATMLAGMLAALVVSGRQLRPMPWALGAATVAWIILGIALVELRIHSLMEVAIGGTAGFVGVLCFVWITSTALDQRFALRPLIGLVLLAAFIHGVRLPAEDVIRIHAAGLVQHNLGSCKPPIS